MIDAEHAIGLGRQAQLLDLSRASLSYRPQPTSGEESAVMRRIDEMHLEHPFAGARMLREICWVSAAFPSAASMSRVDA
jgi:putative transposase